MSAEARARIKLVLGLLLYVASCLGLLAVPQLVRFTLAAYPAEYPLSQGPNLLAFTRLTLAVMPNTPAICGALVVVSALLLLLAWQRSRDLQARLFWTGVLANLNFYFTTFLLGMVLAGFFLLPRIANGA